MSRLLARALLVFSLSFATSFGQTPAAAPAQPASNAAPAAAAAERPFTLEEAIALALQKNFDLQLQGYTVENAKDQIAIQEAAFDPTINASVTRSLNQNAANVSSLEGEQREPTRTNTTSGTLSVTERILPTNGNITLSTNISRGDTNQSQIRLNPAYNNSVSARLTQPVLADFGRRAATAALDRARLQLSIANINYKSRVLAVIADTENAYYNLVASRETLRIRQLTLEYNQKLFEENQARRTTGVATDLDVLSAEVAVASARRGLIQSEQSIRDAEDRLLNLINVPNFDVRVGPVAFSDYREGAPSFAQSYKRARDYYPQTLSAEETIKQLEIDLDVARRNQLPDLNLIAQLGYVARPTTEGYLDVVQGLPRDPGNNWSLGLNYSMPWGRHADKARYRIAQTNLNSQKKQLEQLEQSLLVSVRSAVRAIEFNLAAVEIAAKTTELAIRQYDQQKARFDAGLATSRQVLLIQDDLEEARFDELTARLQLRRAVAELHRLEGTSLDRFRVQLPQ